MADKKEKMLKKYLEKKRRQTTRDDLLSQIAALSKRACAPPDRPIFPTKVKKAKKKTPKDTFEERLFAEDTGDEEGTTAPYAKIQLSETRAADVGNLGEHETSDATDDVQINETEEPCGDALKFGGRTISDVPASYLKPIDETWEIERCTYRLPLYEEQRRKLDIFYDEAEIVSQVKQNLITFIQGETGCGKTTQIPQFLLENGFRAKGMIGVTQPRRLSAISTAARINAELNESLCGYKIRYENSITNETRIKVVTEGVLFREIQSDFLLTKYSVIILDEVHERTINVDMLIGLLSRIVAMRNEQGNPLRLILMSATVAVDDFRKVLGDFHTINVAAKAFKVNVFYEDKTDEKYLEAIQNKIGLILTASSRSGRRAKAGPGKDTMPSGVVNDDGAAILVFLPSKEDIYTLKAWLESSERDVRVLPLHSGLSKEDQGLVYQKYAERKIILSTNIAETSITIDDVVFVIDSGRVKYKIRDATSVKYQVGFINKSSARQRMGRAGRVREGVCYRIYSGVTYESFADKGAPQIYLEPLDSTLLQLKVSGIENIFAFPFMSPPCAETVQDAVKSLEMLGALDSCGRITSLGRKMARYALPPRLAKLLCMSNTEDIFSHLAVIAAMLSIGFEVRKSEAVRDFFIGQKSDLTAYLSVYYAYVHHPRKHAFVKECNLNSQALSEISKLSRHLANISGHILKSADRLASEEADKICRALYYLYSDQIAVNAGGSYVYSDGTVFITNDSISVTNENIVFEHISCGRNREYVKNITVIDKNWFGAM